MRRVAVQNLQNIASKAHWAARPILRFMMSLHLTLRNNEFQSAEKKKIVKMVCVIWFQNQVSSCLKQNEESSLHQLGLQVNKTHIFDHNLYLRLLFLMLSNVQHFRFLMSYFILIIKSFMFVVPSFLFNNNLKWFGLDF